MAIETNAFSSYKAVGNREDLTDIIYNVDPFDTPFMTGIKRKKASAVTHEWQSDTLAAASTSNAQYEGDVVTPVLRSPTTRLKNICQISRKDAVVTGTQEVVNKAGRTSELRYQLEKAGRELRRDMESILLNNQAGNAGATATARTLRGFPAWLRTNVNRYTGSTSGTKGKSATANGTTNTCTDAGNTRAFTESLLRKVLQLGKTNGAKLKVMSLGPHNKQNFSLNFTGRASARQAVDDDTVLASADLYAGDFGTIKVVTNIWQRERDALLYDPDYVGVAYLRSFTTEELAKTGDWEGRYILAEYTLEVGTEKAHGVVADVNTTS